MTEEHIDVALLAATGLYAVVLDGLQQRWRDKIEPDWIWVEVAIGVGLSLAAAGARTRARPHADWRDHERDVWRAFALAGAVIVPWQLARMALRHAAIQHYVDNRRSQPSHGRNRDGDRPETTAPLAEWGRVGTGR